MFLAFIYTSYLVFSASKHDVIIITVTLHSEFIQTFLYLLELRYKKYEWNEWRDDPMNTRLWREEMMPDAS